MRLTQITTVKGRGQDVQANMARWLNFGIEQLVLVDYGCPDTTGQRLLESKKGCDPRVTIVEVSPALAGPFFNPGRAKNIGVQAAKNENLLFLDADTYFMPRLFDQLEELYEKNDQLPELVTFLPEFCLGEDGYDILGKTIPINHTLASQVLVRNGLFYRVNGYSEEIVGWGAESFDFILRASSVAESKLSLNLSEFVGVSRENSEDEIQRFMPHKFSSFEDGRSQCYRESIDFFKCLRESGPRAQPGRFLGLKEFSNHVRVYSGGVERNFNPGVE